MSSEPPTTGDDAAARPQYHVWALTEFVSGDEPKPRRKRGTNRGLQEYLLAQPVFEKIHRFDLTNVDVTVFDGVVRLRLREKFKRKT